METIPDDEGGENDYFSCPQLFVPSNVWEFLEQLEYLERYPHTAPPFHEQDPRFLAAKRYYMGKVMEYESMVKRDG